MSNFLVSKSVSLDFPSSQISVPNFCLDLEKSSLNKKLVKVERDGDSVGVYFTSALTVDEQNDLDSIITNHKTSRPIVESLMSAEMFGRHLVDEYKELNILRGRTTVEVDQILLDLDSVLNALFTGSLYVALDRITAFTPTTLVTQADKDDFISKIQNYLGL